MHPLLRRLLAAALILTAPTALAQSPDTPDTEVSLEGGGDSSLYGSLMRPTDWKGGVAVLMQAGSGPSDRDGNSTILTVRGNVLKLIAQGLAAEGVASLRVDKRCIAKSAAACPGEDKLRFSTYVDDMAAWARYLAHQPQVRRVMLLGHSEGATIATLAAAQLAKEKVPVCGVLSLAGAGRPFGDIRLRQIRDRRAPPAILDKVAAIEAALKQGRTVEDVPPALRVLYRPAIQPYVISQGAVSPTQAAAGLTVPLLVLQGDTDLQVTVEDARLLAQAQPAATLALIPGANHMLKAAPADPKANIATYADPALPLAPGVMEAITGFIHQAAPGN
ncbi:alpha/beta hydrolase fold-containing protein [Nitrospirillum viridazoti Y2]|uniref:AB hydrolase-1 domain-containing protein n=1 Tax=Nitrospirillum amazonense TaxID=28077 RepID=A0A560I4K6_9PROT|nr:alpha/beta fold hydrolase [Nitrospirillum amazonense]EGY01859.1 alpha/beta hydrolase fold-containing protein [Nitrospirillum amazonense Y2]TWB52909.1 hypothetical protein FBZ92_11640 [Nitrospirillum amazonense]